MIKLHIGEEQTTLLVEGGTELPVAHVLPLGSRSTAAAYFRHEPPTADEMENAITAVEDVVMPLHKLIAPGAALMTADPAIRNIALLAGVAPGQQMPLSLEATERLFDRLASVVTGTPASHAGIPGEPVFAATLLILREFMHHLKFSSITVHSEDAGA